MTQIRCLQCGQTDAVDLEGSYLVQCDRCEQKFTAFIVRGKPLPQFEITCPKCKASELLPLNYQASLKIICNLCGHQFFFTNGT